MAVVARESVSSLPSDPRLIVLLQEVDDVFSSDRDLLDPIYTTNVLEQNRGVCRLLIERLIRGVHFGHRL